MDDTQKTVTAATAEVNASIFEVEVIGPAVVLTASQDMGEFNSPAVAQDLKDIERRLELGEFQYVVLDFRRTDFFGSTVVGQLIQLWKSVRARGGRMALCGLSPHEAAILKTTRLDSRWTTFGSREEALESIWQQS